MGAVERGPGTAAELRFGRKNGLTVLESLLIIPRPPEIVFPFFADAANLETITPAWLRFEILAASPIDMKVGALIEYRLRVHGVRLRWESEITAWEPPHRFVDEQRRGPYRKWVHEHTFARHTAGTEVRDSVRYAVPGGWLADFLFVRRDVRRIFEYRARVLHRLFA